jgi:glutathione S-transferase
MKLIGSLTSPYTRKVRVVLFEKNLPADFVVDIPWTPQTTVPSFNPLGKVPVWVNDDGSTLFDSRVIVEYLDSMSPVGKLIPASGRERAEVKTWEALADGLLDAALLARMEAVWPERKDSERSSAWIDRQLDKIQHALQAMSHGLGEKAFCSGIHLSLSDIAVGCAVGYLDFRFPQIDWRTPYPNLHKLYDKLSQRPSFAESLPS